MYTGILKASVAYKLGNHHAEELAEAEAAVAAADTEAAAESAVQPVHFREISIDDKQTLESVM